MVEKKTRHGDFLAGLLLGLLILALYYFISSSCNASVRNTINSVELKTTQYEDILLAGWESVDVESAMQFIKEKNIQIITFVDDKGRFYISDREGKKIEGWCMHDGTKIRENCSSKHSTEFLYSNHLTFLFSEGTMKGNPAQANINIVNGGYSVCIDPYTGLPCE